MELNHFTYRKASLKDKEQLMALGMLSYSPYQHILEPEHFATLYANLHNEEKLIELIGMSTCFVCQDNDRIVGMAYFISRGHPWDIFKSEWSYIRMVGVDPHYQGLGIAKTLTKMCLDLAVRTNEHTVALHTSEFMNAARHIYESLGFKQVQQLPLRLGKVYWLYTLDLH